MKSARVGQEGTRPRRLRRVVVAAMTAAAVVGALVITQQPAFSASAITLTVTAAPSPVNSGQNLTYSIAAANTGGAVATGLTLTDTFDQLNPPGGNASLTVTTNVGSCSSTLTQVSCSAPSVAAGQTWMVTVAGSVSQAAGTTLNNSASLAGTESGVPITASASAATVVQLPAGFAKTKLAHGLAKPTVFAFAPNGDVYIGEQAGAIVIYRNGAILPNPVITLNVLDGNENGLLGLALDPNFSTDGYMYVSYTTADVHAQLSRITVQNDTANLASEKVFYKGNQLQNTHHSANDLQVGPDGKLWWSVGDNVPSISNARTLTNIYGKLLRFNLDGSIPADNPFLNTPGAVRAIYASGLRNPFRFTFLPNGQALTEDTGSSFWEELNKIQAGGNYGWDLYEGNCFSCGYINPVYAYGHIPNDGAISAVTAYTGSLFPQQYANHVVFIGDYVRGDIEEVKFDASYSTPLSDTVFDAAAGSIADLQVGPDGALYYVSIFEGNLVKITPSGPFAPMAQATATPSAGLAPLTVQFSSAGSSDAHGLSLTYSWNFGDGSPVSTSANPSHMYNTNGTYAATLTASNGSQTGKATAQVVVGHTPPNATITTPVSGATYSGGDAVNFSGTANDAVDGSLPPSAYTWQVDFYDANGVAQPFYRSEVPQPYVAPINGVVSGSFPIPTDLTNTQGSFYRITLTVVDSLGLSTTVTRDIHPNLTSWSASTNLPGAGYVVDGTWQTDPVNRTDVAGVQHVLSGMPTQTVNGTRYRFYGWADGSALTDSFANTSASGQYVGNYDPVQTTVPAPWQSVDVGSPLMVGSADYSPSTQTFYVDGGGADIHGPNDQFHYVYQTVSGNGTIVARVRYQSVSDAWAKAGVMIKQSTTAGSNYVNAFVTPDVSPNTPNINGTDCVIPPNEPAGCTSPLPPVNPTVGNGVRMQYNFTGSKTPASSAYAGYSSPNKWLKLQRAGNTFTSWLSANGTTWTQIGSTTVTMTGPVTIGLFDVSHDIGQVSSVAFDNVSVTTPTAISPVPPPWTDTDVGAPAIAGSASYANGVFTVNGGGVDIWGTSDQSNYVYRPTTGNGTIIARVTSQTNTSANAKSGIIWKESTAAGSPYILIAIGPGYIKVQNSFNTSVNVGTYTFPNAWVKLTRSGNVFTAYVSSDGVAWNQVAQKTLTIATASTVGLFECSHNGNQLGTATFDNVSFTPAP